MRAITHRRHTDGNALIFVLWMITFLSALIITLTTRIGRDLHNSTRDIDLKRATNLAERGVAIGLHRLVFNGDSLLTQTFEEGEQFAVTKSKEAALINPNFMVINHPDIMRRVFVEWGVSGDEATKAVNGLRDWVDPDDRLQLGGSEFQLYSIKGKIDHPYNRPFFSVEEMLLVDEFAPVARFRPDWFEYFTVRSAGPVDLGYADSRIIRLLTGLPLGRIRTFVANRNGQDRVMGSEDDFKYSSVGEYLDELNLGEEKKKQFEEIFTVGSQTENLVSVGIVGTMAVEVKVTFRNSSGKGEVISKRISRLKNVNETGKPL